MLPTSKYLLLARQPHIEKKLLILLMLDGKRTLLLFSKYLLLAGHHHIGKKLLILLMLDGERTPPQFLTCIC